MNQSEIEQITREIGEGLLGRQFGKVFPLSETSLAIDFNPHAGVYLFVDFAFKTRSAFLITRKLKVLERSSTHSTPFVLQLRKLFSGKELISVTAGMGSIRLNLTDGEGDDVIFHLQLAGSRPNIFVIDNDGLIVDVARQSDIDGQKIGDVYGLSMPMIAEDSNLRDLNERTLSSILDDERREIDSNLKFTVLANAARKTMKNEIAKRQKLLKNLAGDLANHGNADEWKRFGDLILANVSNLRRGTDTLLVTDYYDPEQRELAVPADRNHSPTEVAEIYFRKYTKARNALAAIAVRTASVEAEIERLEKRQFDLEFAIGSQDEQKLMEFVETKAPSLNLGKDEKKTREFSGARKFLSSDGFEILVGKKAKDNDHLTFRIAKALDLWLHAADYPGSHVVIRNPNRKEIPAGTILEAARLAAFYSDAREKPKAAVNYTPKKFVNKPKRSTPGLASLSSFKTILVESGFPDSVEKA